MTGQAPQPCLQSHFNHRNKIGIKKMKDAVLELIQSESPAMVRETLVFLLEECTIDEAPTKEEVKQWQQVLQQRGGKFISIAQLCQKWVEEQA